MKQLMCSHPVIIVNPNLYSLLSVYGNYYVNGSRFALSNAERFKCECRMSDLKFSSKILGVNIDNIDDFYVCDESSGETFPMFLAVPCGKCELCRNKKSLDWQTRCFLETQTSPAKPLFFTLTYRDSDLNLVDEHEILGSFCKIKTKREFNIVGSVKKRHASLSKLDIQKFMKRFRINLKRAGYDSDGIRYYICGEYGSKTKRPHYHGLFWNLPYIPSNEWHNFSDCLDYSWNKGYTMIAPAGQGAGKYCLKYMRKGSIKPNSLCMDEFYLSSRRKGGLGSKWLEQNMDYFLSHPEITNIKVNDKFSSSKKIHTFAIPDYFKNKLYPTLSRLIPKNIRDAYKLFNFSFGNCFSVSRNFRNFVHDCKCKETSEFLGLEKVFTFFSRIHKFYNPNVVANLPNLSVCSRYLIKNYDIKYEKFSNYAGTFEYLRNLVNMRKSLKTLLEYVSSMDVNIILEKLLYRDRHLVYVDRYVNTLEEKDLDYEVRILRKRAYENLHKEIF